MLVNFITQIFIPIGILTSVAVGVYLFMVVRFWMAWKRRGTVQKVSIPENAPHLQPQLATVVVAFKNEAQNLPHLFDALAVQTYPLSRFEVLLVNDASNDGYVEVLRNHLSTRIRLLHSPGRGKKEAVRHGVENAEGEVVLVTDADCVPSPQWVEAMVNAMATSNAKMVIGTVAMSTARSFWERFQQLDFMSLQLSGGAAAMLNRPIMCNGASLGFRKRFFLSVPHLNHRYLSGDDMFLLHQAKRMGAGIEFLDRPDAVVRTRPETSLGGFLHQRIRWASKAKGYTDTDTLAVALVVALSNAALVALLALGTCHWPYWVLYLACLVAKVAVEVPLFLVGKKFFGIVYSWPFFTAVQLIHPFYTVGVAAVALFANVKWKGERVIRVS